MFKAKELRDKSIDELESAYQDLCHELFKLVNEHKMSKKLDQPHRLREKRRDKARILTVLQQKRQQTEGKL